jgi:hypothetical protein
VKIELATFKHLPSAKSRENLIVCGLRHGAFRGFIDDHSPNPDPIPIDLLTPHMRAMNKEDEYLK